MTSLYLKRAGAAILALEVAYLLLMQLSMAVFMPDTSEIDHTESAGSGALLFLGAEAVAVLVLLWAAALLALPAFAGRGPTWARVAGFGLATAVQVLGAWSATANALAQDAGPDVVINGLMVLFAVIASAACLLGLRGEFRRTELTATA
ncbi:hypothetical protein [Streptomyces sp. NPDC015130]|uniref:hypothetical protein n=1 Tax=Streptomyces sp. NPDC015130 TaxID=3364940 RepID=UPI0036FB0B67